MAKAADRSGGRLIVWRRLRAIEVADDAWAPRYRRGDRLLLAAGAAIADEVLAVPADGPPLAGILDRIDGPAVEIRAGRHLHRLDRTRLAGLWRIEAVETPAARRRPQPQDLKSLDRTQIRTIIAPGG